MQNISSANSGSDDVHVICKLRMKVRKVKKSNEAPKLQYKSLLADLNLMEIYTNSLK